MLERIHALHATLCTEFPGDAPPHLPTWARQIADDFGLVQLAGRLGDDHNRAELEALLSAPAGQRVSDVADDLESTGRVAIGTYHGAKGRTFSAVILPALTEGVVPIWALDFGQPVPAMAVVSEERRNFYVALTRSRGSVLLYAATRGVDNRGRYRTGRGCSRFAYELANLLGVRLP